MNWFQVQAYLKYLCKAKYRRGHRIHPPFAFDLVRYLFYEKHQYYHFDIINDIRNDLSQSKSKLLVTDLGAGSKKFKGRKRSVRHLIKYNATPQKQGELISRLVVNFKPDNIIELGTSLGIGTLYLAMANSNAAVHTIEGCERLANEAAKNFSIAQVDNVNQHVGNFSEVLPGVVEGLKSVDVVYFDGHHDCQATLDYFNICLSKASTSAVFIFDDIYWSKGMAKAWEQIVNHPQVSVSFDLFRFGIVILNKEVKKQHYMVRWP
ncbi:class I SAM-dependent methyltransferase [Labilibacter sediminis]|nr:class I SAM-dependent methyltransferase [Labilibacter sediminis]